MPNAIASQALALAPSATVPQSQVTNLVPAVRHAGSICGWPIVADGCNVQGVLGANATYGNSGTFRTPHYAATKLCGLRILYNNIQVEVDATANSGREITPTYGSGTGTPLTLTHVGLEDSSGNIWPITFNNGSVSVVIPAGGYALSDPIGIAMNAGDQFWLRPAFSVSAGGQIPVSQKGWSNTGDGFVTGVDSAMSGSIAAVTSQSLYTPSAIFGLPTSKTHRSRILIGDSITAGFYIPFDSTVGWAGLAMGSLLSTISRGSYAWTKIATGSLRSAGAQLNFQTRQLILNGADDVVCAAGVNDIGSSAATVESLLTEWANRIHAANSRCYFVTMPPAGATSTDGYTTLANQTAGSNNATRVAVNNWIRGGAGGVSDGYFELADVVESSRDSGLWAVGGSPVVTGTATGGSTTQLIDSTKTWTKTTFTGPPSGWGFSGYRLVMTSGANAGQSRSIHSTSNTTTILIDQFNGTPASAFSNAIAAGDGYQIWQVWTHDGTHPSATAHASIATTAFSAAKIAAAMQG